MNHSHDQGFSDCEWIDYWQPSESDHYSLVSEQESIANEPHLTPRSNNGAADLKGKSVRVTDDQASRDKKRNNDRAYRLRCKENKKKMEEEVKDLRKENAALHKKLHKLGLKPDSANQQNDLEHYCKMEFRLDCHDEELRAHAMKIVGGVTGMKRLYMDIEENRLILHGQDIDTLSLQSALKKICNARLLSLSTEAMVEHKNNEGKITVVASNSQFVAQNSVPMTCTASYSYPFAHVTSAYPKGGPPEKCSNLTKTFLLILIFLAIYASVLLGLVRSGNIKFLNL